MSIKQWKSSQSHHTEIDLSSAPIRRIAMVVGTRPNFVKAAPLWHALNQVPDLQTAVIHTGQHYDAKMCDAFFDDLGFDPDVSLGVGSGTHAEQTAEIMIRIEQYLSEQSRVGRPIEKLIVFGDVNSTLAAALAACKLHIPIAHIEAGLRSGDRRMPEEQNRILTDAVADDFYCTEPDAVRNLKREGKPVDRIHLVGNIMIDSLLRNLPSALLRPGLEELGLDPQKFAVLTMHRPSNVDDPVWLRELVVTLDRLAGRIPIVFPAHPRTVDRMDRAGIEVQNLRILPPQGYLDFLCLTAQARFILTDSGGLQEESTALQVPCLTLRENTERPITVTEGTSTLIGRDLPLLEQMVHRLIHQPAPESKVPELWDGRTAERIRDHLVAALRAPMKSVAYAA